ncbi:MAG: agmatine deiminase AguA [Bacteroidetes bacterium HLUCCA01]|nr:MAG: agmatine deiminase AguA [Bacteroidetes bacterium HLUCCA01]
MTPAQAGYRMPAEWHPHSGTLLSWPQNPQTWPGERLGRVERVYAQLIRSLYPHETVHLLVDSPQRRRRVLQIFAEHHIPADAVRFHVVPCNDVWARDFGPILVRNAALAGSPQEFAITNWGFNAWGGKYPPYHSDNAVPAYLSGYSGLQRFDPDMILEGGSIETNGNGVMLVTESVLLNENRNPHLTQTQIEQFLCEYLGQEKIIWLGEGLAGDDTDGHIDDLSRFLNERTIMTMVAEDPDDVNHAALQANLQRLRQATDAQGRPFDIVTLPMPTTRIEGTTVDGSEFVPASYANFYIANGLVLVPLYDPRYDQQALDLFSTYFPDRTVTGIDCRDLVWGQGSIHCITQQLYGME